MPDRVTGPAEYPESGYLPVASSSCRDAAPDLIQLLLFHLFLTSGIVC